MARILKRPAPAQHSDDEEREDVRARERKRVKIEKGLEAQGRQANAEEVNDDTGSDSTASLSDPEEEESSDEDESMEEDGEAEWQDDALLQAYEESRQRQKGYIGATSQGGILKSINLVDFMCHRHLTVEFGPKMNFLVGHNGSGKSAVLTAIAVALGGKAMTTGRGQGLKDLIRKGAEKAVITLVMANAGPRAFKPDVYDPHIVIERTISSNGSTGYKFKSSKDGKILASKRSELTAICDNFHITIDSPLTILTQDQARSFLQNSDAQTLYKFFLTGTQLATLLETYQSSKQNIEQIEAHIHRQEDAVPALKEKIVVLRRRLAASEAIVQQKARYKDILNQMAWAFVIQREKARDKEQEVVREKESKIDQAQLEVNSKEKKSIVLADEIKKTEEEISNHDEARRPLQKAVSDAKDRVKKAKQEVIGIDSDIAQIKEDLDSDHGGLRILQAKIDAKLKMNVDAQRNEHAKLVNDRGKFEDLIGRMRKDKPKKQQQLMEKSSDLKIAKTKVQDIQYQIDQQNNIARNIQEKINNLEGQSLNRLSAFGQGLDNVMREIDRTRWRHSPPLGPLGMYVKLQDHYYRDIVQSILGNTLCSFAVRDPQDRSTLIAILQKHMRTGYRPGTGQNQPPAVLLHHGDVFDFSRGDLARVGPTILSKLTVENQDVLRLLITLHRIERTFLAKTVQEANNEMKRMHNNRILDQVSYYSADHQQISGTISSKQSGPTPHWKGFLLFTKDLKDEVQRAREDLHQCDAAIQELAEQKRQAQQKVQDMNGELKEISVGIKKLQNSLPTAEARLDEIREKLAEISSTEMENWEADREDRLRIIAHKESQLQQFLDERQRRNEDMTRYEQEVLNRQKAVDDHDPQKNKQTKLLTTLVQQRTDVIQKRDYYGRKQRAYEQEKNQAAATVTVLQNEVNQWTERARNFCAIRVETTRSVKDLTSERNTLEASIKEAEQQLGVDTSQLMAELRKAKTTHNDARQNIAQMKRINKIFHRAIVARQRWWSDNRSNTAIRAKTAFIHFEGLRGMEGRLEFDHEKEKLHLIIHTTTREENEDGGLTQRSHYKSAKVLSGGERSFSTVSLLLALWSTIPCPIRALDEWDVFLDAANRKVAAKSLMDGARESDNKQFILITPQDMSGIEVGGPDKRLIRMADPNRNQ
ncbi:uncharacterized protein I303_105300 [Kwoniella dejecticola CBS 10117]|uniref:RecF/RecN/SMC N-terminal domain-containing protein n=1 Tax=Kwoniella dejecticola CBS 10117 TaxID=1296121 RepID=A0A1A6A2V9_9TREE|nr:uncharacterized protein I303_05252 [Kwoniella dejecticola CBS 10117]OBR84394.1 hypothetical protein I303_05252 [Kwoniella dejecticola CBS 10117]